MTSRAALHGFTDAEHLVERGNTSVQVDAVAHKQFVKAEVFEGVFRQLAVKGRRFLRKVPPGIRMVCSLSNSAGR